MFWERNWEKKNLKSNKEYNIFVCIWTPNVCLSEDSFEVKVTFNCIFLLTLHTKSDSIDWWENYCAEYMPEWSKIGTRSIFKFRIEFKITLFRYLFKNTYFLLVYNFFCTTTLFCEFQSAIKRLKEMFQKLYYFYNQVMRKTIVFPINLEKCMYKLWAKMFHSFSCKTRQKFILLNFVVS